MKRPYFSLSHNKHSLYCYASWGRTFVIIENPEEDGFEDIIALSRGKFGLAAMKLARAWAIFYVSDRGMEGVLDPETFKPRIATEEEVLHIIEDCDLFSPLEIEECMEERKFALMQFTCRSN